MLNMTKGPIHLSGKASAPLGREPVYIRYARINYIIKQAEVVYTYSMSAKNATSSSVLSTNSSSSSVSSCATTGGLGIGVRSSTASPSPVRAALHTPRCCSACNAASEVGQLRHGLAHEHHAPFLGRSLPSVIWPKSRTVSLRARSSGQRYDLCIIFT